MIDFPANPTVGQSFSAAGVTWVWDGTKWFSQAINTAFLPLAGGTMLGPLTLQSDPTAALQPATKQYVDVRQGIGDNRIINGDMRIDQRNNGASGTAANVYTIDRWLHSGTQTGRFTWQRQSGPSAAAIGFPYYLGFTTVAAYALLATDTFAVNQRIEADFISDFLFGTANAQPVTLSFWATTNTAGTYSGSLCNDTGTRSYPFSFTLNPANTWTKIVILIPGDTIGTWVMNGNANGAVLRFDLGSGANFRGAANAWVGANIVGVTGTASLVATTGAAIFFTGVKLEIGTVATPFNRQSLAKSLADCQRYYTTGVIGTIVSNAAVTNAIGGVAPLPVRMRASPSVSFGSLVTSVNITGLPNADTSGVDAFRYYFTTSAAGAAQGTATFVANAEL